MDRTKHICLLLLIAAFVATSCRAQPTQLPAAPTSLSEPASTPSGPLLTEAEVPRVSLEEAQAALESGSAVIVDVRAPAAYEASHIAGAINIPLGEIERNPAGLALGKDQWIITYCT